MRKHVFIGSGWYGLRIKRVPSRYYVLRDLRRHPPLFTERYGSVLFHRWLKIGDWELGWK